MDQQEAAAQAAKQRAQKEAKKGLTFSIKEAWKAFSH